MIHVLWEDATEGSIGWQNRSETLPWQGYFRLKANDTIELAFDCYGRGKMKCARLYKTAEDVWEGHDYRGRFVRIEKMMEMRYCTECKAWHIVDGTEGFMLV